ncbi:MAG: threonine--tRNA ligase [Candidatus Omnitrophica bacterium]|nr:threonine--tRNA ligase [Candidatus Omnitrophota bacterium]
MTKLTMTTKQRTDGSKSSELQASDPLYALRHSASHVMAQAIRRLWPETKLAIGPPIENGFYYDIDCPEQLTDEHLARIESEMGKIVAEAHEFKRSSMPKAEALRLFEEKGEHFKAEIIRGIPDEQVSIFTDGDFSDLCDGPHTANTSDIKAFKLLSVAGAYWRGIETNPMLQRIYGTAWDSQEAQEAYLEALEEARRRDHRKLGTQLDLWSIQEEAGPGMVFFHPKGAQLRWIIEDFLKKEHLLRGYSPLVTPHLLRADIWRQSGHYDYYKENMYILEADGVEYAVKPMNCPGHIKVYQTSVRSWRDLPVRFFELGNVHRNEKSGVLHGLLRVRGFTQDDAHIFCLPEQLVDEIVGAIDFMRHIMQTFGFEGFEVELSTRPEKSIGEDAQWELAEEGLKEALNRSGMDYEVQEGEGAFYGPKIDIKIKDALGRSWQCATIQCDYFLPERFDVSYVGKDGQKHQPIMVHRALLGSMERFMGTLVEHYGGAFPVWLAPVQAVVIPISDDQLVAAQEVTDKLRAAGVRVELDSRSEKMQNKIRLAETQKIPFMLVLGKREVEAGTVSVRARRDIEVPELENPVLSDVFIEQVKRLEQLRG